MVHLSVRRVAPGWKRAAALAVVILAGVCAGSVARAQATTPPDEVKPEAKQDRGQPVRPPISVGDDVIDQSQAIKPEFTLSIAVAGEPDATGNYRVDAAGNISMRYAGVIAPISLKDKTPLLAQDAVAAYLKTYIKNPVVKIGILEVPRQSVFIGGSVKNPGVIYINTDTTLLDVITRAEYTEASDLSQVMIVRKDLTNPIYVNFERFIRSRRGEKVDDSQNPLLHDKDRIWVTS